MSNKEKDLKNMEEINIKMSEYAKKLVQKRKRKIFLLYNTKMIKTFLRFGDG